MQSELKYTVLKQIPRVRGRFFVVDYPPPRPPLFGNPIFPLSTQMIDMFGHVHFSQVMHEWSFCVHIPPPHSLYGSRALNCSRTRRANTGPPRWRRSWTLQILRYRYPTQGSFLLKGHSNEIFYLNFFSSFEPVWATDQWVEKNRFWLRFLRVIWILV